MPCSRLSNTCGLAKRLETAIAESELFEVCAPVALNIVCFGLKEPANGALNTPIMVDLQERRFAGRRY